MQLLLSGGASVHHQSPVGNNPPCSRRATEEESSMSSSTAAEDPSSNAQGGGDDDLVDESSGRGGEGGVSGERTKAAVDDHGPRGGQGEGEVPDADPDPNVEDNGDGGGDDHEATKEGGGEGDGGGAGGAESGLTNEGGRDVSAAGNDHGCDGGDDEGGPEATKDGSGEGDVVAVGEAGSGSGAVANEEGGRDDVPPAVSVAVGGGGAGEKPKPGVDKNDEKKQGAAHSSSSSLFSCLSALNCMAARKKNRSLSSTTKSGKSAAETAAAEEGVGEGVGDDDGGGKVGPVADMDNAATAADDSAVVVTAIPATTDRSGEEERTRSFTDSPESKSRKTGGILKRLSGSDRSVTHKTSSRARAELRSVYHDAHEDLPPPSRSRSRSQRRSSASRSGISSLSKGGDETISDVDVDEAVARLAELLAGSDTGEADVGGLFEDCGADGKPRRKKKSSVYFDAFDSHRDSMTMTTEMQIFGVMYDPSDLGTYAPATVANRHPRQSVSMVEPETMLLHETEEVQQPRKRLSSFLTRRRSSTAAEAAAASISAATSASAPEALESGAEEKGGEKRKSRSSSVAVSVTPSEPGEQQKSRRRTSTPSAMRRRSTEFVRRNLRRPRVRVALRGYPGELTESELAACQEFRSELRRREERGAAETGGDGAAYRQMVDAFGVVEEEPYALCRFLRARNFDVSRVLDMMEGGVDVWRDGRAAGFYPDADEAVGAPVSVLLTQYPFLYHGSAKNGCPVSYFRAGAVSVEGVECVTDLDRLTNLAWHSMMHTFPDQVRTAQEVDPDVVRCESIAVFDLKGLSASQLNARTLEILKRVVKINICFPEVLNCMVILNAPGFFSFSWRVIKTFLDARTASKIAIFADEKRGREWLLHHIDESELLSDYGGKSIPFDAAMKMQGRSGRGMESIRRVVELVTITPRVAEARFEFDLASDEKVHLRVYTRSCAGADFVLLRDGTVAKTVEVRNPGMANPAPFNRALASAVNGPGKFQIVAKSKISSGSDYFLVVGWVNRNSPEPTPS